MSGDNLNDPSIPNVFAPLEAEGHTQLHLDACWEKVSARMRVDLGDAAWRSWIKPLRVGALQNSMLTIEADSSLARDLSLIHISEPTRR